MTLVERIRQHPLGVAALVVAAAVAVLLIALASIVPFRSEAARTRIVAALEEHLQSDVELGDLSWRVLPQFRAEGRDLVIRHKGRTDVPPLIGVKKFAVEGNILGLLRRHVSSVTLEGLDVQIPPRQSKAAPPGEKPRAESKPDAAPAPAAEEPGGAQDENPEREWTIDRLLTTDGRLAIVQSKPDREPKAWAIHTLELHTVGFTRTMPFDATLTNAIPKGEVVMRGTFGPWAAGDPGESPIAGDYTFADADLSVFKGIAGTLSARGNMDGTIDRIETRGETDTPDFMIRPAGHPVAVHAKYHAIVDGTNGNTFLEQVDLKFLDTEITTKGGVVKTPGQRGRTLTLAVQMGAGQLEDVLRLVVKSPKPSMTGALALTGALKLPPGEPDVLERLELAGGFSIDGTRFTDPVVQQKINDLSLRGRGQLGEEKARSVGSNFEGRFELKGGVLRVPAVAFDVPGATVRMAGTYHLEREAIDFEGMLLMDAKVSETVAGVKGLLLKLVDPLFKKPGGGSAVPIAITGTRDDPKIGLDKGRVFKRD